MKDQGEWVRLSLVQSVGARKGCSLLDHFGNDPGLIFKASKKELCSIEGITEKIASDVLSAGDFDIDKELGLIEKNGVKIITRLDSGYPENLKNIYSPPFMIYVKGDILEEDSNSIAIVGTRRASIYGQENARKFAGELARKGFTITSGMAAGIDTFAHRGALDAGGRTIAVLGSGLNSVYPEENAELFLRIAANGACISEFPMNKAPLKQNFPMRNRIVCGLSLGVVVIEAGEKSGALITARIALEEDREVFSLPGRIDSNGSRGTLALIKEGAKLIQTVDDITEEFMHNKPVRRKNEKKIPGPICKLEDAEKAVYAILSDDPRHIDDIIDNVPMGTGELSKQLLHLEIKGLIKEMPGKRYIKK